jgi:hypothetical protein
METAAAQRNRGKHTCAGKQGKRVGTWGAFSGSPPKDGFNKEVTINR